MGGSQLSPEEGKVKQHTIAEVIHRYDSAPFKGGAAEQQWSTATNLPFHEEVSR